MTWGWSPNLFIGPWLLRGWQIHSQSHPIGRVAASQPGSWHLGRSWAWSRAERIGMERLTPREQPGHHQVILPLLPSKQHRPARPTARHCRQWTSWNPGTILCVSKTLPAQIPIHHQLFTLPKSDEAGTRPGKLTNCSPEPCHVLPLSPDFSFSAGTRPE